MKNTPEKFVSRTVHNGPEICRILAPYNGRSIESENGRWAVIRYNSFVSLGGRDECQVALDFGSQHLGVELEQDKRKQVQEALKLIFGEEWS